MAISRRLRFEILRRDGYTCRYCGAKAPDVQLEVDHVIAATLGGSDEPANLVTACEDCNRGKSSVPADAQIVEDVAADALRWSAAMQQAAVEIRAEQEVFGGLCERFRAAWELAPAKDPDPPESSPNPWIEIVGPSVARHSQLLRIRGSALVIAVDTPAWATQVRVLSKGLLQRASEILGEPVDRIQVTVIAGSTTQDAGRFPREDLGPPPLPDDWRPTIERFLSTGLAIDTLIRLARVSLDKVTIGSSAKWRYFCGCAWRQLTTLQESARRILESEGQ